MSFKRQKVLSALLRHHFEILRDTGPHTIVGRSRGVRTSVPRHNELDRRTVRAIAKQLGLDWDSFEKDVR
jgi:predicted RNA binding protein YcfA (HicA-like mRNA interferase family)